MTSPDPEGASGSPTRGAPAPATPTPRRGFFRRHWLGTTLTLLVVIPLLGFTIWAGVTLQYSYSEGTRTGFVQKLSKKGWVCKTWEGEMAMTAQPGVAPTIFAFTVRDDSVASAITAMEGKQVTLWYSEHRGVPTSCFGETGHFVSRVGAVGR